MAHFSSSGVQFELKNGTSARNQLYKGIDLGSERVFFTVSIKNSLPGGERRRREKEKRRRGKKNITRAEAEGRARPNAEDAARGNGSFFIILAYFRCSLRTQCISRVGGSGKVPRRCRRSQQSSSWGHFGPRFGISSRFCDWDNPTMTIRPLKIGFVKSLFQINFAVGACWCRSQRKIYLKPQPNIITATNQYTKIRFLESWCDLRSYIFWLLLRRYCSMMRQT